MKKILIAYFSASGVTAGVAKNRAAAVGGELFEIRPQTPYTAADLNWNNPKSRSSVEMNDKSFRPAVANRVENMADYDTIFIGFPIWWYVAPTIINTFLEQYDLRDKIIVPFATSGGSGMGAANEELQDSCRGALLKPGKRFAAGTGVPELKLWAEELGI